MRRFILTLVILFFAAVAALFLIIGSGIDGGAILDFVDAHSSRRKDPNEGDFGDSVSIPSVFKVSIAAPENGIIMVDHQSAAAGSTVTLTVHPDETYNLKSITASDVYAAPVDLTIAGEDTYTFTMPQANVKISADFEHHCLLTGFTDVNLEGWYHQSADKVLNRGLMDPMNPTTFGPYVATTRAVLVIGLYRMSGSPEASPPHFDDVPPDANYASAVGWAVENGIVSGLTPTEFHPEESLTREQMATILYRYADFLGMNVTRTSPLTRFTDANKVHGYAVEPMSWAFRRGYITGMTEDTLAPQEKVSRAQTATLLARFAGSVDP